MTPAAPIGAVRSAAYRVPTDRAEADGTLSWDATTLVTCEVEAGGETGFGYGYAARPTALFVTDVLAPVLSDREGLDTGGAWRAMVDAVRNHGRQGVTAMAISVADAALHDLRGKLVGVPLSTLLGRCREAVPAYGSGGFLTYSRTEMDEQIAGWREAGVKAMKIKVSADPTVEGPRIAAARRSAGDDVALMIDANGACSRKEALEMAAVAAEAGVVWFEEPVSSGDLEGLRLVRDRAPPGMEIAAGEYGYDAFHFRALIDARAVDVLQADATRCCGLTGLLQADALAWSASLPLSIHCAPALHLQVGLALQRLKHLEWFHDHVRIESMLIDGAPVPGDGALHPAAPDRPGLGLTLRASDAEAYRVWPAGPM